MKPTVAITVGDYNGIGPEIALKAVLRKQVWQKCTPVLIGPEDVFARTVKLLRRRNAFTIVHNATEIHRTAATQDSPLLCTGGFRRQTRPSPGMVKIDAGRVAGRAIMSAVRLAMEGAAQAIVTAPVSKKGLHRAGYRYPGQTEFVQHLSGSTRVAMVLASGTMRVGLATIHVPLRRVARILTPELLEVRIRTIHEALITDWRIRAPKIAVLGLNPHAGEGGEIGTEENLVITPVVRRLQKSGLNIAGPFPADAFFARYRKGSYDAIIAMYHDQGLIPLKMSSVGSGVNVSVGLPIVRTSPDHGTAYDIAGKGCADPGSMIEAILLAAWMANGRMSHTRAGKR